MSRRLGHRGYIGSRPYFGERVPQHVQNLVVRDFCERNGFTYLLSAAEYAMPACYMVLEDVIQEAETLSGIVLYSIFMLPQKKARRLDVVERLLDAGVTLHGAVENIHVPDRNELAELELIWAMRMIEKTDDPAGKTSATA
jgi:sporadic carbohydrate cluster protein (TIGR04323 family)